MFTALLFIVGCAAPVLAYNNGQFIYFFSKPWEWVMRGILNNGCSVEHADLTAHPEHGSWTLVSCILDHFDEVRKTEMAIVSVALGLLPMALQFVGPNVADVAVLGMQRPVLAALICVGSTCPTLQSDRTGLEMVGEKQEGENSVLWPKIPEAYSLWVTVAISVIEYGVVGFAAGNAIFQGYQLSFGAVSFISMIIGSFGNTYEAFSPLLWVLLPLPVQALGMYVLYLGRADGGAVSGQQPATTITTSCLPRTWQYVKHWTVQEMTPCAFKKSNTLNRRMTLDVKKRCWILFLNWAIKFCVWVQVIYGTIVLSSVLFISLFTALEVVGRFLAGAVLCRVVLEFEIYGLREVSKINV